MYSLSVFLFWMWLLGSFRPLSSWVGGWMIDGWAGEDQVLESVDTAIPLGTDLAATFSYGLSSER